MFFHFMTLFDLGAADATFQRSRATTRDLERLYEQERFTLNETLTDRRQFDPEPMIHPKKAAARASERPSKTHFHAGSVASRSAATQGTAREVLA
jgi:hypothetical protein